VTMRATTAAALTTSLVMLLICLLWAVVQG
jgi:hypothetical protein